MDTRTLRTLILGRLWIVAATLVLVEGLIAGVTWIVSEQYQARSLVRLGKVEGADLGAQGAVVDQVQMELEDQAQVKVTARPYGIVLVTADASTPAEAVTMATDVTNLLVSRSKAAIELTLRERKAAVEALKASVEDVDLQIKAVTGDELKRAGAGNAFVQYMTASQLKELFDLRTNVRRQLQQAEVDLIRSVTDPTVLWEIKAPTVPFRPRWTRNLVVGAIFGIGFGVALAMLLAVLQQAPAVGRETPAR
jgi:hypothetical protein